MKRYARSSDDLSIIEFSDDCPADTCPADAWLYADLSNAAGWDEAAGGVVCELTQPWQGHDIGAIALLHINDQGLPHEGGDCVVFDLAEIWEMLTTPEYLVIDDDGRNIAGARVRPLNGTGDESERPWLYVDDVNGWDLLPPGMAADILTLAHMALP